MFITADFSTHIRTNINAPQVVTQYSSSGRVVLDITMHVVLRIFFKKYFPLLIV